MRYVMQWLSLCLVTAVSGHVLAAQSDNTGIQAADQRVIFVATVKNAASYLPTTLRQMDELGAKFKSYQSLFFIDKNDDQTEQLLRDYVQKNPEQRQLIVDQSNQGGRTDRIAYARNQLMKTALGQGYLHDNNLLIQVDMDDVFTGPAIDEHALNQALGHLQTFDAICANPRGFYYDRWALRTQTAAENCIQKHSCEKTLDHWLGADFQGKQHIAPHLSPIPVQSCFGGMAIYKTATLRQCLAHPQCVYRGRGSDWQRHKECEHVSFHSALQAHAQAKLAIVPSLIVGPMRQVSSQQNDHWIAYYVNDKAYPRFADYVFSTQKKRSHDFLQGVNQRYGTTRPTKWQGVKVIYVNTQDIPLFYSTWLPRIQSPFVLITAGGDENIPGDIVGIKTKGLLNKMRLKSFAVEQILDHPQLLVWYTQNNDQRVKHAKLKSIPIGLGYKAMENKDLHGEKAASALDQDFTLQSIVASLKPFAQRKHRVFSDTHLNDTSRRHQHVGIESRAAVYAQIKNNPLIDFQTSARSRSAQWQKRGEYQFSLSLIGNGFDCHRTWESLILGNIVLLQSSPIDDLFAGLPVVIIHDWHEINEENLAYWAQKYQHAFDDPRVQEKLTSAYWLDQIKAATKAQQQAK